MGRYDPSQLKIEEIDKIVEEERLFKISSSSIFVSGTTQLNPDGLFSENLGSLGTKERFKKFGYIDLKVKVLHPFVYEVLKMLLRSIDSILNGSKPMVIKDDKLSFPTVKDRPNTFIYGYEILYKHFKKFLVFLRESKKEISQNVEMRLSTLEKLKTSQIFITKFLVIPPGYRDINIMDYETNGTVKYEPINDLYLELIRNTQYIKDTDDFRTAVQKIIAKIHGYFLKQQLAGKSGKIKAGLGKKPINYAARGVISISSAANAKKWDDYDTSVFVPTGYVGIPIHHLVSLFFPFFMYECTTDLTQKRSFFTSLQERLESYSQIKEKTIKGVAKACLDLISEDYKFGFEVLAKLDEKNDLFIADWLKNLSYNIVGEISNPKRFVMTTRYPISNKYSDQFLGVVPITGTNMKIIAGYVISPNLSTEYSPAFLYNPSSASAHGADYDGDQENFIGVFSKEGNDKIRKTAWFRHNNTDIDGKSTHLFIGNEQNFALYRLTKTELDLTPVGDY